MSVMSYLYPDRVPSVTVVLYDILSPPTQTFYTSKSQSVLTAAESEAGDSGVGSIVWPDDTDLATPLTRSQEDIPSSTPSPRRSLTDAVIPLPPTKSTLLMPERSHTADSLAGQPVSKAGSSLVTLVSGNSLTTQSSTSSASAMLTNGIEE